MALDEALALDGELEALTGATTELDELDDAGAEAPVGLGLWIVTKPVLRQVLDAEPLLEAGPPVG